MPSAAEGVVGSDLPLLLLPGLGADGRLFEPQRAAFPGLRVIERIEPDGVEPLAVYAARLAASIEEPEGPYILGGSSMGGMVALEMARLLRPSAVVLLGSAVSGAEVRGWLRAVECLAHPLPDAVINFGRLLSPLGAPLFGSSGPDSRGLFLDMLAGTPTSFIRWASRAVIGWRPGTLPDVPVHRIHGARDIIIRAPGEGRATIVAGAGHLVNLSHPAVVNGWLRGVVGALAG